MGRLKRILREELSSFHPRLQLARVLLSFLPTHSGRRLRAAVLRRAGLKIGRGTLVLGTPTFAGEGNPYKLLRIGDYCWLNMGIVFDIGAPITIGDRASIGHNVLFITSSHDVGEATRRASGSLQAPITISEGAWLGARCTLLPGVTIGEGAVVAAGAIVARDVPAHTIVGGVPARPLRSLESLPVHQARVVRQAQFAEADESEEPDVP